MINFEFWTFNEICRSLQKGFAPGYFSHAANQNSKRHAAGWCLSPRNPASQPPMLEKHTLARSFVSTNDKNLITQTTFIAHIFQYVLQSVFSRFRYSLARMSNQRYKGFFCPLTIVPSSCSNRKYNISKHRLMHFLCWWRGAKMNNCKQGIHRSVLSRETTGRKISSSRSSFSAISWASGSSPVFIQCTKRSAPTQPKKII